MRFVLGVVAPKSSFLKLLLTKPSQLIAKPAPFPHRDVASNLTLAVGLDDFLEITLRVSS